MCANNERKQSGRTEGVELRPVTRRDGRDVSETSERAFRVFSNPGS